MTCVDHRDRTSDRECFGFHRGTPQKANLGDGNGWVDQTVEYRQNFGIPFILGGTCWESLLGGKHFRLAAKLSIIVVASLRLALQCLPPEWPVGEQWCYFPSKLERDEHCKKAHDSY